MMSRDNLASKALNNSERRVSGIEDALTAAITGKPTAAQSAAKARLKIDSNRTAAAGITGQVFSKSSSLDFRDSLLAFARNPVHHRLQNLGWELALTGSDIVPSASGQSLFEEVKRHLGTYKVAAEEPWDPLSIQALSQGQKFRQRLRNISADPQMRGFDWDRTHRPWYYEHDPRSKRLSFARATQQRTREQSL